MENKIIPTEKSPEMESALTDMLGFDRKAVITGNTCACCDAANITPDSFKDELSFKEYRISGLCQECQDKVFG